MTSPDYIKHSIQEYNKNIDSEPYVNLFKIATAAIYMAITMIFYCTVHVSSKWLGHTL